MAHGLAIYDASGAPRLEVTDRITRLLLRRYVPADESSSVVVPGFDAAKGVAFVAARLPGTLLPSSTRIGHEVSVSGETVSWSPGFGSGRADGDLLVFAYA